MKKLKALFETQAQMSARILAAALLIGTSCAWYAILKPELRIKPDESTSLRRRIEAAVAPGHAYIDSPVLVRTGNKRYLVTIQESRAVTDAYKAELSDYLKSLAKKDSRAQLDVVFAKSPTLLVKSAVASLFHSSSAPIFLAIVFLALVRLFQAPIAAVAASFGTLKKRTQAVRSEREIAQHLLDLELADLQAEANKAFAAQAATAESQRLAYEKAISSSSQFNSVADILAKVPQSGPRSDVITAAPLNPKMPEIETQEFAYTASAAGGLTFIEEKPEEPKKSAFSFLKGKSEDRAADRP